MMKQAGFFRTSVCAVAAVCMTAVHAQDQDVEAEEAAAEEEAAPAAEQQPPEAANKIFMPLVRVTLIRGAVEVKNPDVGSFAAAIENKVYPLGSQFRTGADSSVSLVFSNQESVQLLASTELTALAPENNPDGRVVRLHSGKIKTSLREALPDGCFGIELPNAIGKNMAGRGEYSLAADANTESLRIRTITGSAWIEGPQYHIPALRAANIVDIQTSADRSFTRLTSVSGDFAISLSKGEDGPVVYGMSPKAVVKIWRENAPVGGRPVISILVVSPTGIAKHRFAYAEGRPGIATGELVNPAEAQAEEVVLAPLLQTNDNADQKTVEKTDEAADSDDEDDL